MSQSSELLEMAIALVADAKEHDLECRLLGSLAVLYYVGTQFEHRPFQAKDIDLVADSGSRRQFQLFFGDRGWLLDQSLLLLTENRETYVLKDGSQTLDLYYDSIDGSHAIVTSKVLLDSYPAISWTVLLLTKLQRVRQRDQDRWDTCALLQLSPLQLDKPYLTSIIGSDWGLYTTVTDNLSVAQLSGCNASEMIELIRHAKRSVRWRLRSVAGRRLKWWTEIYDASVTSE